MPRKRFIGGLLAVVAAAMLMATSRLPHAAAQQATPVATPLPVAAASPVPGSVPCTNLFGIALGNACVLIVHGSPDAGPVDVYIDGQLVLAGDTFGALGEFIPVPAGEHRIQIVPNGAALDAAVLDGVVTLSDGIAYEVAALGPVDEIRLQALAVDTRPVAANSARLRVVHAATDAPAIDLALTGGDVMREDIAPGEVSAYADFASDVYDLEARVAGTDDLALPLPGIALLPNTVYTLFVTGLVEDGSLGFTLVPVFVSPDIAGAAATPVG